MVARGVVDPAELHRRTDSLIRHAGSAGEARDALRQFGRTLEDGHFGVRWPKPEFVDAIERFVRGGGTSSDLTAALDGTAETTGVQNAVGMLPSYNFSSGVFEEWEKIDGVTMYDTILKGADEDKQDLKGRDTCYSCTIRCKRVVEISEGPYKVDPHYGGPEYETTSTFGNYCGISDLADLGIQLAVF